VAWKAVGNDSLCGRFLQGLIQVSAGLLRRHLQTPDGARRLMAKATARFDEVELWMLEEEAREYMGLNLGQWRQSALEYLEEGGGSYPFLLLGV
jgi:predicted metal-dependent hydrolase